MARLESDRGRLLISFQYRGPRCREYLGLTDTRDNQRAAAKIIRELEFEIALGKFATRRGSPTAAILTG